MKCSICKIEGHKANNPKFHPKNTPKSSGPSKPSKDTKSNITIKMNSEEYNHTI